LWVDNIEDKSNNGTRENYKTLIEHLRSGQNCVAEELRTMAPAYRSSIEAELKKDVEDLKVTLRYFEKDLVKATRNVLSRPDEKKKIEDHLLLNCVGYYHMKSPQTQAQ